FHSVDVICSHFRYHFLFFFYTVTTLSQIYTLSLHDALPIYFSKIPWKRSFANCTFFFVFSKTSWAFFNFSSASIYAFSACCCFVCACSHASSNCLFTFCASCKLACNLSNCLISSGT